MIMKAFFFFSEIKIISGLLYISKFLETVLTLFCAWKGLFSQAGGLQSLSAFLANTHLR